MFTLQLYSSLYSVAPLDDDDNTAGNPGKKQPGTVATKQFYSKPTAGKSGTPPKSIIK